MCRMYVMDRKALIAMLAAALGAAGASADWGPESYLTQWSVGGSWTSPNNARCLAASGDTVYLVWHDYRMGPAPNRGCRIFFKYFDGSAWSEDALIGAFLNSGFQNWNASCAVDQSGRLHVVWESNDVNYPDQGNYDIVHRSLYNSVWSAAVKLTTHPQFSWHPAVAAGPGGRLDVFWQDNRGGTFRLYHRMFDGSAWQGEYCAAPQGSASSYPSAASTQGRPAVAWQDFRTGINQIFFMTQGPGGWGTDSAVSRSTAGAYIPCLVADQGGNLHLAWEDYRDGNSEIYYRRLPAATGAWEPEVRVTFDLSHSRAPVMACRGDSLVDLFWADDRDGGNEIYTVQSKRGYWGAEQRLTFQEAASLSPAAAADARGNLHLAWTDMRGNPGYAPEIYHMSNVVSPWPKSGPGGGTGRLVSRLSASPNPASGPVVFEFDLERPLAGGAAALGIYDLAGRLVARRNVHSPMTGRNTVSWDGRGEDGKRPASGVYLARLEADGQSASRRVVIIR